MSLLNKGGVVERKRARDREISNTQRKIYFGGMTNEKAETMLCHIWIINSIHQPGIPETGQRERFIHIQ